MCYVMEGVQVLLGLYCSDLFLFLVLFGDERNTIVSIGIVELAMVTKITTTTTTIQQTKRQTKT